MLSSRWAAARGAPASSPAGSYHGQSGAGAVPGGRHQAGCGRGRVRIPGHGLAQGGEQRRASGQRGRAPRGGRLGGRGRRGWLAAARGHEQAACQGERCSSRDLRPGPVDPSSRSGSGWLTHQHPPQPSHGERQEMSGRWRDARGFMKPGRAARCGRLPLASATLGEATGCSLIPRPNGHSEPLSRTYVILKSIVAC